MQVTLPILSWLLSKETPVLWPGGCPGGAVSAPALSDPARPARAGASVLYVTDRIADLEEAAARPEAPAFLLSGPEAFVLPSAAEDMSEPLRSLRLGIIRREISAPQVFDRVCALFLALKDWDLALKDACLEGASYDRLFRIVGEVFDFPLLLQDRRSRKIAAAPSFAGPVPRFEAEADGGPRTGPGTSPELRSPFLRPIRPGPGQYLCANIFRNHRFEGRILAASEDASGDLTGPLELLAHFSRYIARLLPGPESETRDESLRKLLAAFLLAGEQIDEKDAIPLLEEKNWRLSHEYLVVVFEHEGEPGPEDRFRKRLEAEVPASVALPGESRTLWVINRSLDRGEPEKYFSSPAGEFPFPAGISGGPHHFNGLRQGRLEAEAALRLGRAKNTGALRSQFADHVPDYILERAVTELPGESLLPPGLAALERHDSLHGTDLLKTLRVFVEARFGMTAAARRLSIHRLTLSRRLEKIREIAGTGGETLDDLFALIFSIKFLSGKVRERGGPEAHGSGGGA